MNDWQLQCAHCSQIFNARDAIWCKCSYQFPTKICPFCLKCFCDTREAYAYFWEHVDGEEKRKNRIIGSQSVGKWLGEVGILNEHDGEDIERETTRLKTNFFKAAYKLGYFSKEEIVSIRKIINYTPAELLEIIKYASQNKDVWKYYRGIILTTEKFNNQNYYVVAFPAGTHASDAGKVQEKLKGLIIPLYIELSIWKMIAERMPAVEAGEDGQEFVSYSIKEWLYNLIEEAIQTGKEEILISADAQFDNKSNIYMFHDKNWVLHSISSVSYSSLLWGMRNLIPEHGKRFRNDYYVMMKVVDNRIFMKIHPYDWASNYHDNAGLQSILRLMKLRSGLILIHAGPYAEALCRTIVHLAQQYKYSLSVNYSALQAENTFLFKMESIDGYTGFKHIFLIQSTKDISHLMRISQSDFVVGVADDRVSWESMSPAKVCCIQAMNFWRLKKLCSACKIEPADAAAKMKEIALWELNSNGCSSCNGKGYSEEILLFNELASSKEKLLNECLAAGEVDWRDLSLISPSSLLKLIT